MRTDDNGYVVVETVGAFVPFLLLVISILSLVNIVAVQARVHFAMTQAANTLSMYCYTLEVLGIANNMTTLDNKAFKVVGEANAMKNDIDSVISGVNVLSGVSDVSKRTFGWGEEVAGDPKAALQLLMNFGINELRNQVFEELARPLVGRYLGNGDLTGDEYLRRMRVVNTHTGKRGLEALEFYQFRNLGLGNSVLIDRDGNVKLIVEYEIEYTFGGLPLPFSPTLRVTQTVVTKAWLNGSGRGYW